MRRREKVEPVYKELAVTLKASQSLLHERDPVEPIVTAVVIVLVIAPVMKLFVSTFESS